MDKNVSIFYFFIFKTFDNNGTGSFTGYIFKLVRLATLPKPGTITQLRTLSKLGTIRYTFKTWYNLVHFQNLVQFGILAASMVNGDVGQLEAWDNWGRGAIGNVRQLRT